MSQLAARFKAIEDDWEEALATLDAVLTHVAASNPAAALKIVILNNVIVALVSTTEEALRELFQEYLKIIEATFENHQRLRVDIQKANLECGIQQLREYKTEADFAKAAGIVRELSKCLNGEPGYRLFKEYLTYNRGNFRSSQLTETAKNIGIHKVWSGICDCSEVEAYTGESVLETRANKLIAAWNAVFDERDLVVHNISKANGWRAEKIREAMTLFLLIMARISACLVADLTALIAQHDAVLAGASASSLGK
jgi:hypothetical protein